MSLYSSGQNLIESSQQRFCPNRLDTGDICGFEGEVITAHSDGYLFWTCPSCGEDVQETDYSGEREASDEDWGW